MTAVGRQFGAVVLAAVLVTSALVAFAGTAVADGDYQDYEQECGPWNTWCDGPIISPPPALEEDDSGDDGSSRADFEIVSENFNDTHVLVGEDVTINVTVENVGNREGKYTASLAADFDNVGRERVEIEAGEQYVFSFVASFEEADSYNMYVSHDHIGKIFVYESAADRDAALAEDN